MVSSEQLRNERQSLFKKWIRVGSFEDLLGIQEQIADSIRKCERTLGTAENKNDLQFHIERLRLYADGLVWLVLHPHTIRQLAKNPGPQRLIEAQGKAFDQVLESAWEHLKTDKVPVFIADITNVIKIGDLVLCTNPEMPRIVECKTRLPHPRLFTQGRFGRQVSRAMGTLRYLSKGSAKVFGDEHYRLVLESPHVSKRNWEAVAKACTTAISDGRAFIQLSDHEFLWAYARRNQDSVLADVAEYGKPLTCSYFGTSLGLMNMSDGLFPPPIVWPISSELRFPLMEEDIVVAHLVDATAFECDLGNGERIEICAQEDFPIRVVTGGKEYPLSKRFIYDVLYGFEAVSNCVQGLIGFARQLQEQLPIEVSPAPQEKPTVHYVESTAEARKLAASENVPEGDLVVMPLELFKQLKSAAARPEGETREFAKKHPGHIPAYPCMDVEVLRKLMSDTCH